MAVRFWELYEETKEQFRLKIAAGKAGMDTVVSWVHMLEDETIVSRFHGEELAITTGMKADQPGWLLKLVQEMAKDECAGIIINTGMYLQGIPQEVLDWCEIHNFPLLEMPWEMSITELIQAYCMRIIDQKQFEKKIGNAFREVIQGRYAQEDIRQVLGEKYDIEGNFQVFCISVKKTIGDELDYNQAIIKLENLFGLWKGNDKINASYGLIRMEDFLVLILNNRKDKQHMELPRLIMQSFSHFAKEKCFHLGIGPGINHIENLSFSYKRARTAMKMSIGTGKEMIHFDEMGFFKILFSIDDTNLLTSYANEILGPLEEYDEAHGSSYVSTLKSYIKNDRSLMRVAEETFTHRNTVNYRIQNIKRILGCDLSDMDELFPYQVAFYIRDMNKKSI
ncbi:DNA-binding PucR family transcriptional regulator [Mobilisporobacter senegalensis]|uniref:DNA-binding PucR family transcriptional regulator n=1 Tax=Mobilisporobacter senegalensis TaxID=1329262 RepID=A0A3N1XGP7_9FIRM|nr:PucR family transcriptional regulator [Mobilisporobacter senegalensis]ROR23987.1 DNA-binding PucR family transcriptional regulator [Mobilisporobacter senegalensis]